VRTWADWDDARPGFVEIDLVANDGGNPSGERAWTLPLSTPRTGNDMALAMSSSAASTHLLPLLRTERLAWRGQITFTRSRPGNKNDGRHIEQKNWAIVRIVVGYHRYDTPAELLLLNKSELT
jgi:hypothetical protein